MITANNTFFGLQMGTRVSLQDRFVKSPLSKVKWSQFNNTHSSQESWESTITSIPKKDPKTKDLLVNVIVINACFSHLSGSQNHCVLADLRIITAREHSLTNSSRLCCWFQDSKKKQQKKKHLWLTGLFSYYAWCQEHSMVCVLSAFLVQLATIIDRHGNCSRQALFITRARYFASQ